MKAADIENAARLLNLKNNFEKELRFFSGTHNIVFEIDLQGGFSTKFEFNKYGCEEDKKIFRVLYDTAAEQLKEAIERIGKELESMGVEE